MFLVTQTKNGISALELMRHLGVSYGTAWSIKHKLMQVMKEREDGQLLDGIIQMDDAYWGANAMLESVVEVHFTRYLLLQWSPQMRNIIQSLCDLVN
ncbi:MAG: hypothetical protein KZQ61_02175 [Candidatus Thiodiazotropha sp. (ex Lucinoma aequizonata)]|nr:hypothetical protein [Candidatus Thiodiazotropha sp. (ex Lucinoma aequizonata)]